MLDIAQFFVLLVLFCTGGLVAIGIVTVFWKKKRAGFSAISTLLALIAVSSTYLLLSNSNSTISNTVHIYPFSSLFVALFAVTLLLVNALAYSKSKDYSDLSLLLALSFVGMFAVTTAVSILGIFIGLELLAIATAFMILFEGKHRVEAAIKFFILSSVSVAVFSFALALLLPYDGSLILTAAVSNPNVVGTALIILSIVLFVAALGFDASLFPFNFWVPDVYEGSPSYITSLLAGINKKVAFVALIEVFFVVFIAYKSDFSMLFAVLAVLTMFFGNLIALTQRNVKRLFAYSSISQAGYIMIGLATVTQFGLESSIFYIIAHSFMIIGAFAMVMWLESKNLKTIDDYDALNSRNKFAAASLTILMLSMAGIPPLMGFAGKFLLFSSAISGGMVWLAVIGIINSFISIFYYAKVINAMYAKKEQKALRMDMYVAVVVALALAVIIIFGIYPQPMISIASSAARSLLGI
ncbi:MAG: NADH-quinone oxidoreductase subunit N [Candidatus Micrarchaeaceae archaeon]